ncbi:hypothetical protein HP567_011690 [Brevibacillus sp. M2.1A]|uniref:hypothetical protein n=1 Tax=Brevibacillus TaxID=55080 RepID=UPI00156B7163|nr:MULTISPECIES: hypothetical protein [Brevibacillus]MBY0088918.1 hypothetical protein [Brevibacillus brevis]MCC8435206.1 hypothetical protein [Brevibacillus sp. M2.1A]UKK97584.1 hypothetical protein FO446_09210 [Brevibacillus brevis]
MDVEVYYSGQRGGTMPYAALPAFRLFCKQNGFQLKWDLTNKRVDLDSGLKGKVCVLFTGISSGGTAYEWEVLGNVQKFLSDSGMEVVLSQNNPSLAKNTDVAIRFSLKEMRVLEKPRLIFFQSEDEKRQDLIKCLRTEMQQSGIPCHYKVTKNQKQPSIVHIQLQLPLFTEVSKRKLYSEKIALHLASGVLEYFQNGLHIQPMAFLPPNILKLFYSTMLFTSDKESQQGEDEKPLAEEQNTIQENDQPSAEVIDLNREVNSESESEREELLILAEEELLEQVVTIHPVEEVPEQVELRTTAEVYFDYTLIHSESVEKPYLLIGTLQVKNTGNVELKNPIVCLRVSPVDSIKMGGQVLPPKLVETMAVQGTSGLKGWRYLEDDWFAQAMERGEYWIAPIQPVTIVPESTESFQNFQISFMKQEAGKGIVVEGVVLCNDQTVHFSANNRIAVSF